LDIAISQISNQYLIGRQKKSGKRLSSYLFRSNDFWLGYGPWTCILCSNFNLSGPFFDVLWDIDLIFDIDRQITVEETNYNANNILHVLYFNIFYICLWLSLVVELNVGYSYKPNIKSISHRTSKKVRIPHQLLVKTVYGNNLRYMYYWVDICWFIAISS
jgi:hypothetical protein